MERNRAFDDERISAYVDGQLSEDERIAFEAALAQDATLRRKVAVTQLLVREARALEQRSVPRNFILPREAAKQIRLSSPQQEEQALPQQEQPPQESVLRVMVRLGAALVVFAVVFIGLLQVLPSVLVPRAPVPPALQPTLPAPQAAEESTPRMMPMLAAPELAAQPDAQDRAPTNATPLPPATPAPPQQMPLRSPRPLTMVVLALLLVLGLAGFWIARARRR